MSAITVNIEGREQLIRQLRELAGPELKRVAAFATRTAMKPVLDLARSNAPQKTGRLRASIGQLNSSSSRSGFVASRVGTRRDFKFKSTGGEKILSGRTDVGSKKKRATIKAALKKGYKKDDRSAQQYARLIEFGTDSEGRIRRKAGGAHFLDEAITSKAGSIIQTVADELRRKIESTSE